MRKLLSLLLLLWALPAQAQSYVCPDRPLGDSSNACANTRFVINNGGGGGGGGTIIVGTTPVGGGTDTRILFDNAGVVGEYQISGTGSVAMTTSPVFTTPNLGTPSAVTLTNATGLPISTGVSGLGAGVATFLATPSSANLATAVTGETGSGALVFGTSPTLASPTFSGTVAGAGTIPLSILATQAADTVVANATGGTASPTAVALVSCSAANSALTYNTSTHAFGCNTISGTGTVNVGTAGQLAWYSSSTNIVGGNTNANISNGALTLGVATSTIGQLLLAGNTSGTVTITPQAAAGTPTLTLGTSSGTIVATASAPLAVSATTGNMTITGVAGQVLGGAGPAFTATPTLGAVGVATGQLKLSGTTSGTFTFTTADAAGTWTLKMPTGIGTAGQALVTDGVDTASWANIAGSGTVNSGTAGQFAYYATSTNAVSGNANLTVSGGTVTVGQAGSTLGSIAYSGNTSGTTTVRPAATASGTLTLPAATDTLVGKATTDTLTNKTYDTAGTGNSFSINGVAATDNTGTGKVVRDTSPTIAGQTVSGTANFTGTFQKSGNTMTFPAAAATLTQTIASGAKALATGAISSATCTSAQTDTATGTATTDAVIATFNADPTGVTGYSPSTNGMLTIIAYPTSNTVNFKVCNNTTASITPGAITINWRVVR